MTRHEKRIADLLNNPRSIRFSDAVSIAERLGFKRVGGRGSHVTFGRHDEPLLLNFQNRDGFIPAYQAKQLIDMVNKYGESQLSD